MRIPPSSLLMYLPLLALLGVAAVTDFRARRIPNWLTLTVALAGIAQSLTPIATTTPFQSFGGLVIGFALTFVVYAVGGRGAGDVKLMAGIGAWLGIWPVVWVFAAAAIVSMVVAVVQSVVTGKFSALVHNTGVMLLGVLNAKTLGKEHVIETGRGCRSIDKPMPNAVNVLIATVAVVMWVAAR